MFLLCGFLLFIFSSASPPQPDARTVRQAFLANDAGPGEYLALLSFPELLEERPVQMKIFRGLGEADQEIFQAAVMLRIRAPQLEVMPAIKRRFDLAFLGRDPGKTQALLQLASEQPELLKDLLFISLLAEALAAPPPLRDQALHLVERHDSLKRNPAIAEALTGAPGETPEIESRLPDYETFKQNVEPVLHQTGSDDKACVDCHKTHPILRLVPADEAPSQEERVRDHYRKSLRVIDLEDPATSLILLKPTLPEAKLPSPETHGGGIRWEKGSPEYEAILEWIRTTR